MEKTLLEKVRENVKEKTKDWNLEEKEKGMYKELILRKCDEYTQDLIYNRNENFSEFKVENYEVDDYLLFEKACKELGFTCTENRSEIVGEVFSYSIRIPPFTVEEGKEYTVAQKKFLDFKEELKIAIYEHNKILLEKCEAIKSSLEKMEFDINIFKKKIVLDVYSKQYINSYGEILFAEKYFRELGFEFLGCGKEYWRFEFKQ